MEIYFWIPAFTPFDKLRAGRNDKVIINVEVEIATAFGLAMIL
jgi:hypothetical protein